MKLSRHYRVLQLAGPVSPIDLEQAVAASRSRYTQLTARGPLRFYRHDLLADTERAYRILRQPAAAANPPQKTWLARQAQKQSREFTKPPINSPIKTRNFLKGYEITLNARTLAPPKNTAEINRIEDDFCRQVLYRIEGPLLRYRSRRELLHLADQTGIHPFRANLLMAQITESIRQHQLDKPKKNEKQKPSWLLLATATLTLVALINILILTMLRNSE